MDILDMRILGRLLNNCRESNRQTGRALGVSGGAVGARVAKMVASGAIERFSLQVEPPVLGRGVFYIVVTGRDYDEIAGQVRLVGEPFLIVPCVGGVTVCGIVARDEVERGIELARGLMRDVRVLSMFEAGGAGGGEGGGVAGTDLAVVGRLVEDPRRGAAEIAGDLGLSTRTVARSIKKLQGNGAVRFSAVYDPTRITGFIPHVVLAWTDGEAGRMLGRLSRRFGKSYLQTPFVAKNHIVLFMYSRDIFELDNLTAAVRETRGVGSTDLFIPKRITFPDEWIRRIVGGGGRGGTAAGAGRRTARRHK